jgi:hypothetical protein
MVAGLCEAGVEFVVIGGLAARAHGSVRITEDLDICYNPAPENVQRLTARVRGWNAHLRGVDRGLPFIMDERTFRDTPVMTLVTDQGAIDVMDRVLGVGDYADVYAASVPVKSDQASFRALSLAALLASKHATGRPKDREQLHELEALLEMKRGSRRR